MSIVKTSKRIVNGQSPTEVPFVDNLCKILTFLWPEIRQILSFFNEGIQVRQRAAGIPALKHRLCLRKDLPDQRPRKEKRGKLPRLDWRFLSPAEDVGPSCFLPPLNNC